MLLLCTSPSVSVGTSLAFKDANMTSGTVHVKTSQPQLVQIQARTNNPKQHEKITDGEYGVHFTAKFEGSESNVKWAPDSNPNQPGRPHLSPAIMEKISTGEMTCCVRSRGSILAPPRTAYRDSSSALCIPGYRLDPALPPDANCALCDADRYCPQSDDHVYSCPRSMVSLPGSAGLPDCWCLPGYHAESSIQGGQACLPCPVDYFCPGHRRPPTGINAVAGSRWSRWLPGLAHACPDHSDTRGREAQVSCACSAGYYGNLDGDADTCAPCPAGAYCPGTADGPVPCMQHARTHPRASDASMCECIAGYDRIAGACVTACVAPAGSHCALISGGSTPDPVLAPAPCPRGSYCPGGRGAAALPCPAAPGRYCAASGTIDVCPAGSFCAGGGAEPAPCVVPPGSYCAAGSASGVGARCPAGTFCIGGAANMAPCAAAEGRYCPAGGALASGAFCPAGSACAGGVAAAVPCTAAPGFYCPAGTTQPAGIPCPAGSFCAGGATPRLPCAATAGRYCPEGCAAADGVPCPEGYYCAGGTAGSAPCAAVPGRYCAAEAASYSGELCPAGYSCAGSCLIFTPSPPLL
jgi:hypothetical protein